MPHYTPQSDRLVCFSFVLLEIAVNTKKNPLLIQRNCSESGTGIGAMLDMIAGNIRDFAAASQGHGQLEFLLDQV